MTDTPTTPQPTDQPVPETPALEDAPQDVRPGKDWEDRMAAEEPAAREQWQPGDVYAPHDGETSDANLHYADLMADPQPEYDPASPDYQPPTTGTDQDTAEPTTDDEAAAPAEDAPEAAPAEMPADDEDDV